MAYGGGFRIPIFPIGTADGPSLTGTASLVDGTPLPANEIPGQALQTAGMIYVTVVGRFTSTATPGTATIGLYFAKTGVAITAATAVLVSQSFIPLASQTNKHFRMEYTLQVESLGAGGAGVGQIAGAAIAYGLVAANDVLLIPATVPMAAVSIDTTASQRILWGITPSVTTGTWIAHSVSCEYSGN